MVHLWIQEFLSTNKKELKASKQYQVSQKQLQRNHYCDWKISHKICRNSPGYLIIYSVLYQSVTVQEEFFVVFNLLPYKPMKKSSHTSAKHAMSFQNAILPLTNSILYSLLYAPHSHYSWRLYLMDIFKTVSKLREKELLFTGCTSRLFL